ncbi:MAG: glutathione S-transferase family protein [Burkholderiales bacterium]|nr:glutathione S-transferase family protein [Burkholderiales bacterium]
MYSLHIANKLYSSWSLRPWLLMSELGLPFQEVMHPFGDEANWAVYRALSPAGKVPCLVDGAQVVWDSLAIVEYLAERHAGVWPESASARAWARSAAAEMHSGYQALRQHCAMRCGLRMRLHDMPASVQRDVDRIAALWAEGLSRFGGPYLAGPRFSAVDAFFAPVVLRFQTYGIALPEAAQTYAQRIRALPAMQAWVQAALAEPLSAAGHEQDVLAMGEVLQDLRGSTHTA